MAGVITRKPLVGFATAIVFGFLGLLLIQAGPETGSSSGVAVWMFRILGGFSLFAALGSLTVAVSGLLRRKTR